jgi:hypothetical protein
MEFILLTVTVVIGVLVVMTGTLFCMGVAKMVINVITSNSKDNREEFKSCGILGLICVVCYWILRSFELI